jgi:phosphoribosylamine--glycine ligase / phosphoribosylformylglycinamidine cyclo-ligase
MNILIVGSGAREHALAWKIAQSPHLKQLFCLPGNPGTSLIASNLPGRGEDVPAVVEQARLNEIDLVLVGPEVPLAAGLADGLIRAGIPVFGPTAAAAQIESSKACAKAFMFRHGLPIARSQTFEEYDAALTYIRSNPFQNQGSPALSIVIKASGLAAGKGVYLPETEEDIQATLKALLVDGALGEAGKKVLIEERLAGREVSVLAFSDGQYVLPMPPVQDHKRLLDFDRGPNTGGMGTYAPSPACPPELVDQVVQTILHPAIQGLRLEGKPFVGVLYAGLMLTAHGPRLLEFNCRFGDPETQVIIPLLDSDLVEILVACISGRLEEIASRVCWKQESAACVVLAAPGYPEKPVTGQPIYYSENSFEAGKTWAFHAGTAMKNGQLVTSGGRVMGITATGHSLDEAVANTYAAVSRVNFQNMHFRKDIGRQANTSQESTFKKGAYAMAGVSIDEGDRSVELMRRSVRSTFNSQVLSDVGSFGGLFDSAALTQMQAPVMVASIDGVGTKCILAAKSRRLRSLGHDIVNHCVNDILVQGARPLFFLDYIAFPHLKPEMVADLVTGMSEACLEAGCVLLGGETAEMPGVYLDGSFDLAGAIVGVVEKDAILPHTNIQAGDVLVGLPSSGPHTNGYSLIRRIFADISLDTVYPDLGKPLADLLLAPHRCYLPVLSGLLGEKERVIKGLAHLTGGSFFGNIPRILPPGCAARIDRNTWPVPPLFHRIQQMGQVDAREMYRVFNMGIGMIVVLEPKDALHLMEAIPETTWIIGEIVAGEGVEIV